MRLLVPSGHVIGIDVGARRIAWSVFAGNQLERVQHFELKPSGNRAEELHTCSSVIRDAVVIHDPDAVFIEEPYIGRGTRASLQLAQMAGAVLAAIGASTTLNPVLVPVDTWKKQVLGKGGINKEGICAWLEANHGDWLDRCRYVSPTGLHKINQDRVDAICVGLHGVAVSGHPHGLGPAAVRGA
jgi:Holliday junction resolvasome RuvABC endonuclease subunit